MTRPDESVAGAPAIWRRPPPPERWPGLGRGGRVGPSRFRKGRPGLLALSVLLAVVGASKPALVQGAGSGSEAGDRVRVEKRAIDLYYAWLSRSGDEEKEKWLAAFAFLEIGADTTVRQVGFGRPFGTTTGDRHLKATMPALWSKLKLKASDQNAIDALRESFRQQLYEGATATDLEVELDAHVIRLHLVQAANFPPLPDQPEPWLVSLGKELSNEVTYQEIIQVWSLLEDGNSTIEIGLFGDQLLLATTASGEPPVAIEALLIDLLQQVHSTGAGEVIRLDSRKLKEVNPHLSAELDAALEVSLDENGALKRRADLRSLVLEDKAAGAKVQGMEIVNRSLFPKEVNLAVDLQEGDLELEGGETLKRLVIPPCDRFVLMPQVPDQVTYRLVERVDGPVVEVSSSGSVGRVRVKIEDDPERRTIKLRLDRQQKGIDILGYFLVLPIALTVVVLLIAAAVGLIVWAVVLGRHEKEQAKQRPPLEAQFRLEPQDLLNPPALLTRLNTSEDPFLRRLRIRFSEQIKSLLGSERPETLDDSAVQQMTDELNRIMQGEALLGEDRPDGNYELIVSAFSGTLRTADSADPELLKKIARIGPGDVKSAELVSRLPIDDWPADAAKGIDRAIWGKLSPRRRRRLRKLGTPGPHSSKAKREIAKTLNAVLEQDFLRQPGHYLVPDSAPETAKTLREERLRPAEVAIFNRVVLDHAYGSFLKKGERAERELQDIAAERSGRCLQTRQWADPLGAWLQIRDDEGALFVNLRKRLSEGFREQVLRRYPRFSDQLGTRLLDELNGMLKTVELYREPYEDVELGAETRRLIEEAEEGVVSPAANRFFLADVLRGLIAPPAAREVLAADLVAAPPPSTSPARSGERPPPVVGPRPGAADAARELQRIGNLALQLEAKLVPAGVLSKTERRDSFTVLEGLLPRIDRLHEKGAGLEKTIAELEGSLVAVREELTGEKNASRELQASLEAAAAQEGRLRETLGEAAQEVGRWRDTLAPIETSPQGVLERWRGLERLVGGFQEAIQAFVRRAGEALRGARPALGEASPERAGSSLEALLGDVQALREEVDRSRVEAGSARLASVRFLIASFEEVERALCALGGANEDYDHRLLAETGLETAGLRADAAAAAEEMRAFWAKRVAEEARRLEGGVPGPDRSGELLKEFLAWFLNQARERLLTRLLRLDAIAKAYCRDSEDELAAAFYRDSEDLRLAVEHLRERLSALGVEMERLRLFESLPPGFNGFGEHEGRPLFFRSAYLKSVAMAKAKALGRDLTRTLADISQWGYECKDFPEFSRETKGYLFLEG